MITVGTCSAESAAYGAQMINIGAQMEELKASNFRCSSTAKRVVASMSGVLAIPGRYVGVPQLSYWCLYTKAINSGDN